MFFRLLRGIVGWVGAPCRAAAAQFLRLRAVFLIALMPQTALPAAPAPGMSPPRVVVVHRLHGEPEIWRWRDSGLTVLARERGVFVRHLVRPAETAASPRASFRNDSRAMPTKRARVSPARFA